MGKKKKPNIRHQPRTTRKAPRLGVNVEKLTEMNPSWRLSRCDIEGPFGWGEVNIEQLCSTIVPKLKNFESMTWGEIQQQRSQIHPMNTGDLSDVARRRLEEINQDDIDMIYEFPLSGKERIWGIKKGPVVFLLWWDPNHQVYPTQLKHT